MTPKASPDGLKGSEGTFLHLDVAMTGWALAQRRGWRLSDGK